MSKAQSVTYSVLTPEGKDWAVQGRTRDMAAAMKTARGLLTAQKAPQVRVVKEFLDSQSGRNVSTTIFDQKAGAATAAGSPVRWAVIAVAMFAVGFGGVYAVKTFFL